MCSKCHVEKPTGEFSPSKQQRSGFFPWCKSCKSRYQSDYINGLTKEERAAKQRAYKEQRDIDKDRRRRFLRNSSMYSLKKRYRITEHEVVELASHQGGVCGICGASPDTSQKRGGLHVDHDHSTGIIRGLLCESCNLGLGFFMDDPLRIACAIHYLQSTPYDNAVFTEALTKPSMGVRNTERSKHSVVDLTCSECGKSFQRMTRNEFRNRMTSKDGPFCGRNCCVAFVGKHHVSARKLVHGTATGYSYGCRCSLCREAHTGAERNRRLRSIEPEQKGRTR